MGRIRWRSGGLRPQAVRGLAAWSLAWSLLAACAPALAQGVAIPNLWDPRATPERPELPASRTIRFLTDDEFPPLHFAGADGI